MEKLNRIESQKALIVYEDTWKDLTESNRRQIGYHFDGILTITEEYDDYKDTKRNVTKDLKEDGWVTFELVPSPVGYAIVHV